MTELNYRILTQESEIEAIAGEWRQLHERVGRTPFSDYDQFAIWWRIIGKTNAARSPHIITGRDRDGRLAGLLPLMIVRRRGLRVMHSAGNEAYACDMLAEDEAQAAALWQFARRSPHYDFAGIRDVYPETICYPVLSSFAQRRDVTEAFLLHSKWATGAEWIASMPSRINHDPQRRQRRLAEKGPIRFVIHKEGPLPRDVIEAMVRLKKNWTVERGKHGFFDHPDILVYFQELTDSALRHNRLFLSWLTCGNKIIAYDQGFVHRGVLRNFTIAHDPEWSAFSPGILILRNSIAWAIDNGVEYFNHGQGYGNYKANYSNEKNHCAEFTFSGAAKGKLLETAFFTMRAVSRELKKRKQNLRKKA